MEKDPGSGPVAIRSLRDISNALAYGLEHGGLLLSEADLCREFFDLKSGLAGELLQKCVNYRTPLAIVLADPAAHGERFGELVHEHRHHPMVRFFSAEAQARQWLESVAR